MINGDWQQRWKGVGIDGSRNGHKCGYDYQCRHMISTKFFCVYSEIARQAKLQSPQQRPPDFGDINKLFCTQNSTANIY